MKMRSFHPISASRKIFNSGRISRYNPRRPPRGGLPLINKTFSCINKYLLQRLELPL
jgi:hypothetical protein